MTAASLVPMESGGIGVVNNVGATFTEPREKLHTI